MKKILLSAFLAVMVLCSHNTSMAAEQGNNGTASQTAETKSKEKLVILPSEANYTLAIIPTLASSKTSFPCSPISSLGKTQAFFGFV